MKHLQKVPESLQEVQASYDTLYQGWMGEHRNTQQARRILDLLGIQPGQRLADIGCGLGYLAAMASAAGLTAFGVDVSWVAIRKAHEGYAHGPAFLLGDGERLPWPDGSFDHAVNLGSLEHFVDPEAAVREMRRILKPNGKAALLLPNSHHIRAIYYVYRYGEILPELQDFERFATRVEWEEMLRRNGLTVASVEKYDTGMARVHKEGNEIFWYLYNACFRLFGRWIPLNLAYSFIFICRPA